MMNYAALHSFAASCKIGVNYYRLKAVALDSAASRLKIIICFEIVVLWF